MLLLWVVLEVHQTVVGALLGGTPWGEGVLGPAAAPETARGTAPPHRSRWAVSIAGDGTGEGELAVNFVPRVHFLSSPRPSPSRFPAAIALLK